MTKEKIVQYHITRANKIAEAIEQAKREDQERADGERNLAIWFSFFEKGECTEEFSQLEQEEPESRSLTWPLPYRRSLALAQCVSAATGGFVYIRGLEGKVVCEQAERLFEWYTWPPTYQECFLSVMADSFAATTDGSMVPKYGARKIAQQRFFSRFSRQHLGAQLTSGLSAGTSGLHMLFQDHCRRYREINLMRGYEVTMNNKTILFERAMKEVFLSAEILCILYPVFMYLARPNYPMAVRAYHLVYPNAPLLPWLVDCISAFVAAYNKLADQCFADFCFQSGLAEYMPNLSHSISRVPVPTPPMLCVNDQQQQEVLEYPQMSIIPPQ